MADLPGTLGTDTLKVAKLGLRCYSSSSFTIAMLQFKPLGDVLGRSKIIFLYISTDKKMQVNDEPQSMKYLVLTINCSQFCHGFVTVTLSLRP